MPWWAQLGWCAAFVALMVRPRLGVALAGVAMLARVWAAAVSAGRVWMLGGIAWAAVMAFYAMTALWPVLLARLWKGHGSRLAGWMIPLAALESASLLVGRVDWRTACGVAFAMGQMYFLVRTARDE